MARRILWGVLFLAACGPTTEVRYDKEETRGDVMAGLEDKWLAGLSASDAARGHDLARALVADWEREADGKPEAKAILEILRSDFDAAAAGRTPEGRLELLQATLIERQINRLSVESFALGKAVIDGTVELDEAKRQGETLLASIEALNPEVRSLTDADTQRRLRRDLGEAMMDALYAVERKAMSMRLNNYASPD